MAGIGRFWSWRVNLSQIRLQNTGLTTSPTDKTTPAFGFTTWAIEFSVAQTENSVAQTVFRVAQVVLTEARRCALVTYPPLNFPKILSGKSGRDRKRSCKT